MYRKSGENSVFEFCNRGVKNTEDHVVGNPDIEKYINDRSGIDFFGMTVKLLEGLIGVMSMIEGRKEGHDQLLVGAF